MNMYEDVCQSACLISKTTQQISVTSGTASWHYKLLGEFHLYPHQSNITHSFTWSSNLNLSNYSQTAQCHYVCGCFCTRVWVLSQSNRL